MKARLAAAGLIHGTARPESAPPAAGPGEPASARVAEVRSWARERGDRQRQGLRPLGLVFLAVVVTASMQTVPTLRGAGLGVALALAVYAAAVATAITVGWARRGLAAQAVVIGLIGGSGVALAVLQPHGPVGVSAAMGPRPPPRRERSRPRSPWPSA